MSTIDKYLEFLWNCFQYDISIFSKAWIYYYALIPAIGYLIFFFLKWMVLTAPIWLPVSIIIRMFNLPSPKCENCLYKTQHEIEDTAPPRKYPAKEQKTTFHDSHTLLN